jgi:hypothetical protein
VGTVFRRGEKSDFERMLTDMVGRAKADALTDLMQVQDEFTRHGAHASSRLPLAIEQRATPIHEKLLIDAMRLVVEFSKSSGISVPELILPARTQLSVFTCEIIGRIAAAGGASSPSLLRPKRVKGSTNELRARLTMWKSASFMEGVSL